MTSGLSIDSLNCFKAYDIRGLVGKEIDESLAYKIGRATGEKFNANLIVLGYDARPSSPKLASAVCEGILDSGSNVLDIGLSGTEEMYWSVTQFKADAGIVITASHNPIEYNGMKIVKSRSQPLDKIEFDDLKTLIKLNEPVEPKHKGSVFKKKEEARNLYIEKLLSLIDIDCLRPFKILINSGNGAAGPTVSALISELENKGVETNFKLVHHNPDPNFPNGIPNPLLQQNQFATSSRVLNEQAFFGVAFDGDFDRCFFFDDLGHFVPGEYIVGILAEIFLARYPGAKIVTDPRVIWNSSDIINEFGGKNILSKTGHAFMKSTMRKTNAVYGGEMSAHHYFQDFSYCDSGMIPWLLVWESLSKTQVKLSDLISKRKSKFLSSGELNFFVVNQIACLAKVELEFGKNSISFDKQDGMSLTFTDWRFNIRASNTEPLVRLNIETKGDILLLEQKTAQLKSLIEEFCI